MVADLDRPLGLDPRILAREIVDRAAALSVEQDDPRPDIEPRARIPATAGSDAGSNVGVRVHGPDFGLPR